MIIGMTRSDDVGTTRRDDLGMMLGRLDRIMLDDSIG